MKRKSNVYRTEQLDENQDLFLRRLYCRDDQPVVRGPLVALGLNLGGPRDLVEKNAYLKREKNQHMPRFAPLACHILIFFSGEDPEPLLKLERFAPSSTPRYARPSTNNRAYF